jgi:hypothetical protein
MSPAGEQGRPAHGSIPCRGQSEYRACSMRRLWRSGCSLRLFGFLEPAAADLRQTDRRGSFQRPCRVRQLPLAEGCPKPFPEPLRPVARLRGLGDQRALFLCQRRINVQHAARSEIVSKSQTMTDCSAMACKIASMSKKKDRCYRSPRDRSHPIH